MIDSIPVNLTISEIYQASYVGCLRQIQNIQKKRQHLYGSSDVRAWQDHVEAACGESAIAKEFGLYWNGNLGGMRMADVGLLEARTTPYRSGHLLLHPKDNSDAIWIHVTGLMGKYILQGWVYGHEGKKQEYWRELDERRPDGACFVVPNEILRTMSSLKAMDRKVYAGHPAHQLATA